MNREEFEAVLAIEGKYLEVRPAITKADVGWDAFIWEWFNPISQATHPYTKHFLERMGFSTEPVQRTIAGAYGQDTNHKAVKILMKAWEKGHF
jgi:hypothetical protein